MLNKKEFRQKQIKKIERKKDQTTIESGILLERLLTSSLWQNAQSIGVTVSGPNEVNTKPIIKAAIMMGKKVYLPKTMPEKQMVFLPYTGKEELIVSDFGIPEPEYNALKIATDIDLMIVPGIAFALDSGYRVGFGGGYYDRFLANFTGEQVALVPSAMRFDNPIWETEDTDIQIKNLITSR